MIKINPLAEGKKYASYKCFPHLYTETGERIIDDFTNEPITTKVFYDEEAEAIICETISDDREEIKNAIDETISAWIENYPKVLKMILSTDTENDLELIKKITKLYNLAKEIKGNDNQKN